MVTSRGSNTQGTDADLTGLLTSINCPICPFKTRRNSLIYFPFFEK